MRTADSIKPAANPLPPAETTAGGAREADALTVGDYVVMFILFSLPLINLVLALVWGFSGEVNPNRRNYARAWLILTACLFALALIAGLAAGPALRQFLPEFSQCLDAARANLV